MEPEFILRVLEGTDEKHVKFFRYLQVGLDAQLERADSHIGFTKAVSIFRYFSKSFIELKMSERAGKGQAE